MSDREINPECPDTLEIKDNTFEFDDLIDQEFDFYGVDNNCFKLDDVIYEAIEDESDGYRSYLGCVEVSDAKDKIFFVMPVARVVIEHCEESTSEYADGPDDVYKLIDLHDGHCWLCFGTHNYDEWYPCFIFEYSPKGPGE